MKIGSLFSGYGGLDLAAETYFNASTVWHAEFEEAPSKVLAHHWPGVTNLQDVTLVDWTTVEPVDIITGGFPCQDVSLAGRRAGMTEGTRSNLWGAMRTAIETIRPQYAVIENVRGLLSATAQSDSDLEQRPGFMGDGSNVTLRALGRVLGDLADIGYNAQWYGLRAADIGAPHGRYRIFIIATNTRSATIGEHPRGSSAEETGTGGGDRLGDPHRKRPTGNGREASTNTEHDGQSAGPVRGSDGTTTTTRGRAGCITSINDGQPTGGHLADRRSGHLQEAETIADTEGNRRNQGWPKSTRLKGRSDIALSGLPALTDAHRTSIKASGRRPRAWNAGRQQSVVDSGTNTQWGAYEPAIRQWEQRLGRIAPPPTELSVKGRPQLSPVFVEWMMGLPEGWVTAIPGISRAKQLKMLGNGVVPQQALAALRIMGRSDDTIPSL